MVCRVGVDEGLLSRIQSMTHFHCYQFKLDEPRLKYFESWPIKLFFGTTNLAKQIPVTGVGTRTERCPYPPELPNA